MPFKANADRRHRIPKQRRRITNWAEYDGALRQRGSLTVWFTEAAIAAWYAEPRTTPGGQPHYSSLAIATGSTLKTASRRWRCWTRDRCVPCPGVTCWRSEPLYNRSSALPPERDEVVQKRALHLLMQQILHAQRISGICCIERGGVPG